MNTTESKTEKTVKLIDKFKKDVDQEAEKFAENYWDGSCLGGDSADEDEDGEKHIQISDHGGFIDTGDGCEYSEAVYTEEIDQLYEENELTEEEYNFLNEYVDEYTDDALKEYFKEQLQSALYSKLEESLEKSYGDENTVSVYTDTNGTIFYSIVPFYNTEEMELLFTFDNTGPNCLTSSDVHHESGKIFYDSENQMYVQSLNAYYSNNVHHCLSRMTKTQEITKEAVKKTLQNFNIDIEDEDLMEELEL